MTEARAKKIHIANSEGEIVFSENLDNYDNLEPGDKGFVVDRTFPSFAPYTYPNFDPRSKLLYMVIPPSSFHEIEVNDTLPWFGIYSLKKKGWTKFFGPPQGIMSTKGNAYFPLDLSLPYVLLAGNNLYISYPSDHYVYIYDLDGNFVTSKPASSKFSIPTPSPLELDNLLDRQTAWNYRIATPYYEHISFHDDLKLFSRIYHHEQPLKDLNGKLNDGEGRTQSIIFFNENFEVVGETVVENSQIGGRTGRPTSNGFVFRPHPAYQKSDSIFSLNRRYEIFPK